MITSLKDNQIFVFGSNLAGKHYGGAARQAFQDFGATWGLGAGLSGQSYAIPTMGGIDEIKLYVRQFLEIAVLLSQFTFLMTAIGTGIAGYSTEEMKALFMNVPSNIILPEEWIK
jgi:hypothetical protein